MFECWFYEKINDDNSIVVVKNGIISLQFSKAEDVLWPDLFHNDFKNKDLVKLVRDEAIKYAGEKAERLAKEKAEQKEANKKLALKEQMKVKICLLYKHLIIIFLFIFINCHLKIISGLL